MCEYCNGNPIIEGDTIVTAHKTTLDEENADWMWTLLLALDCGIP